MKALGALLVIFGIVGLVYGGLSWTRQDTVIDAGPIEISAEKRESLPISPIAGGLMLVAGVALIVKGGS